VLKVAVVVTGEAARSAEYGVPAERVLPYRGAGSPEGLDPEVKDLLDAGLLHAVQFHGAEQPDECATLAFPYYKAVRVQGPDALEAMAKFRCPRVLADAWSPRAAGGTGQQIPRNLARELAGAPDGRAGHGPGAQRGRPLWLAGGLGPDNIGEAIRELSPELVDASSGLEESPGRKDRARLEQYFREIDRHAHV
jgi:phosphoribosylanthranilate isomerase